MDIAVPGPLASVLDLAYTLITLVAQLLAPVLGSTASVGAIVALTLAVRTVLIPVGVSQVRAELARRRLAPRLSEIRRRWARNPQRMHDETMKLYRDEKASPLAGVLPALLQLPLISVLYGLFVHPVINGHDNLLLADELAGVPLGQSLLGVLGGGQFVWPALAVFLVVLLVLALIAAASRAISVRWAQPIEPGPLAGMATTLSYLPFVTVIFAAVIPLAAAVYLVVSTAWSLVERPVLRRVFHPA